MTLILSSNSINLMLKKLSVLAIVLSLLLFTPVAVLADDNTENSRPSNGLMVRDSVRQEVKQEAKSDIQNVRQKTCETRMETIRNRSGSLSDRAGKMEDNFSSISARVEEFYTSKLVPAGITVSNYDSLVSDISAKKDAVDAALTEANGEAKNFGCDDLTVVKTNVDSYRTSMQKVIAALKEYRTSIKNLIVAVRTAAASLRPSPVASPSPES